MKGDGDKPVFGLIRVWESGALHGSAAKPAPRQDHSLESRGLELIEKLSNRRLYRWECDRTHDVSPIRQIARQRRSEHRGGNWGTYFWPSDMMLGGTGCREKVGEAACERGDSEIIIGVESRWKR